MKFDGAKSWALVEAVSFDTKEGGFCFPSSAVELVLFDLKEDGASSAAKVVGAEFNADEGGFPSSAFDLFLLNAKEDGASSSAKVKGAE